MEGIKKIRLFKVYSIKKGGKVYETEYVSFRDREEGDDRWHDRIISDSQRIEDHVLEEASREEFLEKWEARIQELDEQVKRAHEAFPDLNIEAPEAKIDVRDLTTFKEVVRYDIEDGDEFLEEPVYVLVYKGMRGQYVTGAVTFLGTSGAPTWDHWTRPVSAFRSCSSYCKHEMFAMELVENSLREEGVWDDRYEVPAYID